MRFLLLRQISSSIGKEEVGVGGARIVDVLCLPYTQQALIGIGSVHHIAFHAPTDEQQMILRRNIVKNRLNATPVIDPILLSFCLFP